MKQFIRQKVTLLAAFLSLSLILTVAPPVNAAGDYMGKTVTAIEVEGCDHVSKSTVLGVLKLKPGETLTVEKLDEDTRAIHDLGYFYDVLVNFTLVPEGVKVLYTVMENPMLNEIVIEGANKVPTSKLREFITNQPGEIINTRTIGNNTAAIKDYYQEQGYILAKVDNVSLRPGGVLFISVNEGLLEDVVIKGNVKTKEKVITREMKVEKGQPFNVAQARTSLQNIYNLGYFEDVNMKLNPGRDPNAVVMQVDVVEQRTGVFTIGGGYSQNDGMIGILELGDNNFRGSGDKVKIHWELGGASNRNYEFSYHKPWLDSKRTSLGFSFYNMTNQYTDYESNGDERAVYDKTRKGYELTLGRATNDHTFNYITFKNRDDSYTEHLEGENYTDDANYMANNFGLTRSVILSRVIDTRDNYINPSTGTRTAVSAEFAGLGGDFTFQKYTVENRKYFKIGSKQVLAFRLTGGLATGKISDSNKYAIGGIDTVRGYRDDEFKGDKMLAATIEYRFPLIDRLEGVVFSDIGNTWSGDPWGGPDRGFGDFKAGVGVGVRINTPIGPVRVDVAKGSQGMRTHFSFGGQ
ncbi:MAG: BamA/TamA family outer membrane protein, partial [Sporomusaceae bacterium]|nr:BamA/TamA family outer membrane protein [Sporomusaceae bacterium]